MIDITWKIIVESWHVLVDSSLYMLLGFLAAGTLKAFLPQGLVARHMGKGGFWQIIKASLLGAPLPLCSCAVLPAAAEIRKQGADKGTTAAFLVSTPETGVDSIAVTYALMGPFMAVLRPFAAILTGIFAGGLVQKLEKNSAFSPLQDGNGSTCTGSCGCQQTPEPKATFKDRLTSGLSYAFGGLLGDIGKWFLIGLVLAGTAGALLPPGFVGEKLGTGLPAMLAMLAVATPIYVCATASTPIAAALALNGLSPGACLVFLLAGPATNAATVTVVARILGKKAAVAYTFAILVMSLILGLATDWLFRLSKVDFAQSLQTATAHAPSLPEEASAIIFLLLVLRAILAGHNH